MGIWSFLRSHTPNPPQSIRDAAPDLKLSPYVGEYRAAIDRTQELGFEPPVRLLVQRDCVDMDMRNAPISSSTSRHANHPGTRFIIRRWSDRISFTRRAAYRESVGC